MSRKRAKKKGTSVSEASQTLEAKAAEGADEASDEATAEATVDNELHAGGGGSSEGGLEAMADALESLAGDDHGDELDVADHVVPALELSESDEGARTDADNAELPAEAVDDLAASGEAPAYADDEVLEIRADGAEGAEGEAGEAGVDGDDESFDESLAVLPTSAASLEPQALKQLIEALVFASDRPLTVQLLRKLTRIADVDKIEAILGEIQGEYQERGLILTSVSGGWQFRTRPQFSSWVQQLIQGRPVRLSRAQLETLAIVAYRQPITRPEIDDIRGVDSSATLKLLLDRTLIRGLGKKEEVGRPTLYGTTKEFLDFFSLADLRELPTLREYSELTDESRQVITNKLGPGSDGPASSGSGSGSGSPGPSGSAGSEVVDAVVEAAFEAGTDPVGDDADSTESDGAVEQALDATDEEPEMHAAPPSERVETSDAAAEAEAEADAEDDAGAASETEADSEDPLSRLASRMLASDEELEAPDAELADGTGAVAASADASGDDTLEALADDAEGAPTDEDGGFAAGSRAFTAVADPEAADVAAQVAAALSEDPATDAEIADAAADALVATDDIVDDESSVEPSE